MSKRYEWRSVGRRSRAGESGSWVGLLGKLEVGSLGVRVFDMVGVTLSV
jgi:hypothetical protein